MILSKEDEILNRGNFDADYFILKKLGYTPRKNKTDISITLDPKLELRYWKHWKCINEENIVYAEVLGYTIFGRLSFPRYNPVIHVIRITCNDDNSEALKR